MAIARVFPEEDEAPRTSPIVALALYIPSSEFPTYARHFRHFIPARLSQESAERLLSLPGEGAHALLLPAFAEYCLNYHADQLRQNKSVMAAADLTAPHTWYPFARAMRRRVVYHCGPTNSGKTHNALARFSAAKSGVYCSPLRLLAMEVFDKVNALGVYCTLRTGQEIKEVPFSNHVACTIEMLSTEELYEVAVVDEIQMMADPVRGYAWSRAVLGIKADEIHLCGDPSVLKIVRKVCADTGDDLEVHQEIFEVKLAIEKFTKHKCCVIYGALPPETRRQQATLFNEQDNEYDVLVASDAVGMGLNLNIRRVVFYSLSKYNGDKMVPVAASQVKQIAGRAGRRGSVYPDGLTTTFLLDDLDYLIQCLQQPFEEAQKIGLFPCFEQVEMFASQFPNLTFTDLLDKFRDNCRIDKTYFMCQQDSIKKVANMLERKAEEMATNIADLLGKSLAKASWKPESRQQAKQRREEIESDSNAEQASDNDAKNVSKVGYERTRSLPKTFPRYSRSSFVQVTTIPMPTYNNSSNPKLNFQLAKSISSKWI
ncbi:ATP-dependent RNA helicase SUPV3L1, mitochondrial [Triticum urartu]|uniref:RNA helicase n=1 Tax=Triticum urartu TaxID=4572 RepID=M8AIT9_TRIUA|nr:ATP-dependent RNA helicase SUPV3L1, mitochondrial [Triticum urartu]